MLAVDLSKDLDARLERLSRRTGKPKAEYIQAVAEFIEDLEDAAIAEERLRENLPPISADEMERRLALED